MNLTLKQLFKFGVVCVSACAMTATADYLADSFEEGAVDDPIGEYKMVVSGAQNEITNLAWYAASGDASALALTNAAYADIVGDGPIAGDSAMILNLATEGNTLSRTAGVDCAASPVYVDTLIQFTPSEDEPTITSTDLKIALYVNAQSNLVVVHSMFTDPPNTWTVIPETNSVIDLGAPIDPAKWYRLTIAVSENGAGATETFSQIYIDGTLISHEHAFDVVGETNNATYFRSIQETVTDLKLVSFQGTGSLDELVVTNSLPDFGTPAAVMLTLASVGDGTVTFTAAGIGVTEVESGTEVVMTASDWYQIIDITSDGAGFMATGLPLDANSQVVTSTVSATEDCIVTVTNAVVSGPYPLAPEYDLGSIATWALNYGVSQANAPTYIDQYLLNVAPAVTAELVITSIVVDKGAGTTTITVEAQNDSDAVDFDALNGEVTVYSTADLAAGFGTVPIVTLPVTAVHDTATVVFTNTTDQFLKAKVEVLPAP